MMYNSEIITGWWPLYGTKITFVYMAILNSLSGNVALLGNEMSLWNYSKIPSKANNSNISADLCLCENDDDGDCKTFGSSNGSQKRINFKATNQTYTRTAALMSKMLKRPDAVRKL